MTKPIDEPSRPYCLVGWQPCGCMGIASWIDRDTTRSDLRSVEGKIKRRGYRREVYGDIKGMAFECSEHKALRNRMIAEKQAKKLEAAKGVSDVDT
jgi:hypothetical protein